MSCTVSELAAFAAIFKGNKQAYGQHLYKFSEDGKKESGDNYTKREYLYEDRYKEHLDGSVGLGIVPIDETNSVNFTVIDVDIYSVETRRTIVSKIHRHKLPFMPFLSKSGGLHLYTFYVQTVPAKRAIAAIKQFAIPLGLSDGVEMFPKQTILTEGQSGNWINLPYFNGSKSKQCLIGSDQEPIALPEALELIVRNQLSIEEVEVRASELELSDAPPCLQALYYDGNPALRNEYLFSLGRYYKTKYGDDFELHLHKANLALANPLSPGELEKTVIASNRKKDYAYRCKTDPLLSFCNKGLCKDRKFGYGTSEVSVLSYEELTQFTSDPPYYEWFVNGVGLKFFNETDVINQTKFRELCFRHLHILPNKLKDTAWTNIVNNALTNIKIEEIALDADLSPGATFIELLVEFLERKGRAEQKNQVLFNRVYKDYDINMYIFKGKNLVDFLIYQKQFRFYGQTEIQNKLKSLGGRSERIYIDRENSSVRVWLLPLVAITPFLVNVTDEEMEIDFEKEIKEKEDDKF